MFESATWLLVKGRVELAIPILKSIANTNGVEISEEVCSSLKVVDEFLVTNF